MSKRRVVQTSYHDKNLFACGIQPATTEEFVDLRQHHHPGFGFVELRRNGLEVWSEFDYDRDKTLAQIEDQIVARYRSARYESPIGQWTFKVNGPMAGYLLTRRAPGRWVVTASYAGFA